MWRMNHLRSSSSSRKTSPSGIMSSQRVAAGGAVPNAACRYVGLGENVLAMDALRQAIEAGYANFGWMQNDPDLVPLRGDPEFVAMMQPRSRVTPRSSRGCDSHRRCA
jgi:hypothetical protein